MAHDIAHNGDSRGGQGHDVRTQGGIVVARGENQAAHKSGNLRARATATDAPQECPSTMACETPSRSSARWINCACASGVQMTFRGRLLWPKPGRSMIMTL